MSLIMNSLAWESVENYSRGHDVHITYFLSKIILMNSLLLKINKYEAKKLSGIKIYEKKKMSKYNK